MPAAWNVFYSYAHEDVSLRDELAKFLAPLRHQRRIAEWYDRKIEPGLPWDTSISERLLTADLILLLVSAAFLASDYCFGVEVEMAMQRAKDGNARILPILLKPCLWKESRFSELQLLPRDAKPVISWRLHEDAFTEIANEIGLITKDPPPAQESRLRSGLGKSIGSDPTIVKNQITAYARLYERLRQQMTPSSARTGKMQDVFDRIKSMPSAAFALLPELVTAQSPGEKLAAVALLQCLASSDYLEFLVELIRSEQPFVGYHAAIALEFAVSAIEPRYYRQLDTMIDEAIVALDLAIPGFDSDRKVVLLRAKWKLQEAMSFVTITSPLS